MNICIVSNYRKGGYGESTRPYYLSLYLKEQGHNILHLCDHEGIEDGMEYVRVRPSVWEPAVLKRTREFLALFFKIRLFDPDIIYMHQFNTARWTLATRVMPLRKFVFDAHTSVYFEVSTLALQPQEDIDRIKRIEGQICHDSDYIICASCETKEILRTTYQLNESKLFVVGNATSITPVSDSSDTGRSKSGKEFFTCVATLPFDGFVANEMALQYLFEIAAKVHAQTDKIMFVVLGGGEKPVPPVPNIVYAGYVADLRAEILNADLCLMPYPEKAVCGGARNKFCDFIALGKVVISSPEGMRGMQVLEDGENCLVAIDKNDFAEKIVRLFQSPGQLQQLGSGVLKVKDMYSWKDRAKEVNAIFNQILTS